MDQEFLTAPRLHYGVMSFQFRLGLLIAGALFVTACGGSGGSAGGSGTATTSGDGPPVVVSQSPIQASGAQQTIDLAFTNPTGVDKILMVQMMIAPNLSTPKACWVQYALSTGEVKMMDGSGTGKAGEPGSVSNAQCSIDSAQVKSAVDGNSLKVSIPVRLTAAVTDPQNIFALTSTAALHSGWHLVGTWTRESAAAK